MPLNDLQCKNALPTAKAYKLYDEKGLYLEISPTGYKSWRYRYRYFDKEKRVTLGDYPFLSLADARLKRDEAKRQLKEGFDPLLVKKKEKQTAKYKANQTLELVGREWHQYNLDTWSEGHAADILYRLEMDIFPELGTYPISEIDSATLFRCIQKIEARGAHELARRALQYLGRIFRYGASTGRVVRDITIDLRIYNKKWGRLKQKSHNNPRSEWVIVPEAFEATIDETLFHQAQERLYWLLPSNWRKGINAVKRARKNILNDIHKWLLNEGATKFEANYILYELPIIFSVKNEEKENPLWCFLISEKTRNYGNALAVSVDPNSKKVVDGFFLFSVNDFTRSNFLILSANSNLFRNSKIENNRIEETVKLLIKQFKDATLSNTRNCQFVENW